MPYTKTVEHPLTVAIQGAEGFTPTKTMVETVFRYMQGLGEVKVKSPIEVLKDSNHAVDNWYKWQRRKGFAGWWRQCLTDWHGNIGLTKVHNAIYKRALQQSSADAKMYLERFDGDYRPATAIDIGHKGQAPPEQLKASLEASRKRVISTERPALPPDEPGKDKG